MTSPFNAYKKQTEPEKYQKAQNWGIAIGLQQVDDLTPSKYLINVAKDNIEGKISIDEAAQQVSRYYQKNPAKTSKEQEEKEADEVSARITKLLSTHTFSFSPAELLAIHRFLFTGILSPEYAGKIRTYDITKSEAILNGKSVIYGQADSIRTTLDYDFQQEKTFHYQGLSRQEKAEHLARFIAGIWQIHPFAEGNTRTTAVFTIQYLYTLGFETNNDLFETHSKYFRNALVRANYQDLSRDIPYTLVYLYQFFGNLLLGKHNVLNNQDMQIKNGDAPTQKITQITTQKTAQKILEILKEHPTATRQNLASLLGITADGIKWNLEQLKKQGKIIRVGPDKGGHWKVK